MSVQELENRYLKIGTIPFSSNTTKYIDIPRNNAIRRFNLKFYIEHVAGGSNPTEITETILNVIKKVRLVMDGDDTKFNVDGVKLFYMEKFKKGSSPATNKDDNQAASTTKTWFVSLNIDFASSVLDMQDISALLPAKGFTQLKLEVDWGAPADMFSANSGTFTAANSGCDVEILEVIHTTDNDLFARGKKVAFLDFRQQVSLLSPTQVYPNLEEQALTMNVQPTPALIRSNLFIVKTSAGVYTSTQVTDFALVDVRGSGRTLYKTNLTSWSRMTKPEQQVEEVLSGIFYFDHIDFARGGVQNVFNEGDLKYKFLVPVSGGTIEILTEYLAV